MTEELLGGFAHLRLVLYGSHQQLENSWLLPEVWETDFQ